MSHRPEQVASVIRRAVQEQLSRGLHDPRIRGLVSITKVTIDADLSEARIFVSVLPEEHANLTMQGLAAAAAHLQRRAREGLPLRRMPQLSFVLDDSLKKAAESDAALARANPPASDSASEDSASEFPDAPHVDSPVDREGSRP